MGLDMYLHARLAFTPDSDVRQIFDRLATEEQQKEARDVAEGGLYVSGWSWPAQGEHPERPADPLYVAITDRFGIKAHPGSPHFMASIVGHGTSYRPNTLLIDLTIYYWRKVNAVHRWFVEQVQDGIDECQESIVHPELILDLIDRCERVSADHDRAEELLPSQSGFFFGPTEYDDDYFADIEETGVNLKQVLAQVQPLGPTLMYQSSW